MARSYGCYSPLKCSLILFLVLVGLREAVFHAVPNQLKTAISVGIGLFIALVGLIDAGIIRPGGTPIQLGINGSSAGCTRAGFRIWSIRYYCAVCT